MLSAWDPYKVTPTDHRFHLCQSCNALDSEGPNADILRCRAVPRRIGAYIAPQLMMCTTAPHTLAHQVETIPKVMQSVNTHHRD